MSAVPRAVCALVDARAGECCEMCGVHAYGGSRHHRRRKGMGGDKRPGTDMPANLLLLCGSGVTGCHGWVHSNPIEAEELGLLIPYDAMPADVPAQLIHGLVFLDDYGHMSVAA